MNAFYSEIVRQVDLTRLAVLYQMSRKAMQSSSSALPTFFLIDHKGEPAQIDGFTESPSSFQEELQSAFCRI
jgi:hypothetical protein